MTPVLIECVITVERTTEAPYIIESVTPEPVRETIFKIFEMDSTPGREKK